MTDLARSVYYLLEGCMKGVVSLINRRNDRIAAFIEDEGFTVFELLGGYSIEIGDIVSGNLDSHGGETFRNLTQLEDMDVYVQAIHCSKSVALRLVKGHD